MPLQPDGYTFVLSDDVTRTPVRYRNRYGIEIAGDLYRARPFDEGVRHPALVIGPPHGGVKEQGPGVYAQELARRGFVALAFDRSYNGQSGGEPRHVTSPEIFAEDFSAGLDFLGTLPYIDREKLGAIGLCGSGGFALSAAQVDQRIKAVATSAMYDISRAMRHGWQDTATDEQRHALLADQAAHSAGATWTPASPRSSRPSRPRCRPRAWTRSPPSSSSTTSPTAATTPLHRRLHPHQRDGAHQRRGTVTIPDDIAPRPILLITGEHAHSRYFSDTVHEQTSGPTELVVVPGARHIDLYDRTDLIPFDRLESFFATHLR